MQLSSHVSRPWFKEPWVWFLISFPLAAVVVGSFYIATAIKSDDGLVTDDYYNKGKAINMELRRDTAAATLGITAQVMLSSDGHSVTVNTTSNKVLPDTLLLRLIHPAQDAYDATADMHKIANNQYSGSFNKELVKANHWYVQLEDKGNQWRVQAEWKPEQGPVVMLGKPKLEKVE
ncbi:MAG: FixH family protein [Aquitalea sp.]|nr:FixH family protein [Aquitalea sp.]